MMRNQNTDVYEQANVGLIDVTVQFVSVVAQLNLINVVYEKKNLFCFGGGEGGPFARVSTFCGGTRRFFYRGKGLR